MEFGHRHFFNNTMFYIRMQCEGVYLVIFRNLVHAIHCYPESIDSARYILLGFMPSLLAEVAQ